MRHPLEALARAVVRRDGLTVSRPVGAKPGGATFPLAVVRTRPRRSAPPGRLPVLAIPGGPGMASVVPYAGLRRLAAAEGLDLVMVEHRGVGLSRRDQLGADLPVASVTAEAAADDLAAALDAARVERAVVYGSSYGSFLAQVLTARHPGRVAALVLDSPLLSPREDLAAVRAHRRRLLWDGEDPALAPVAAAVREAARAGVPMAELTAVVQEVHDRAGPAVLLSLLRSRREGRRLRTWRWVARLGTGDPETGDRRCVVERDLVAGIAHGQIGFGLPPDGGPLDPQLLTAGDRSALTSRPTATAEPFDAPARLAELAGSGTPLVVVSADRDLCTPPPVAERAAGLVPGSALVRLGSTGHSALDGHQLAAVRIAAAVADGAAHHLPGLADHLTALPRRGHGHLRGLALREVVGVDSASARS
ncbi:alpha/beta hydrolase [Streptomyces sp. NP160]|uniref:alpha/beta fold hydrolase n=1 Tax=Streptomyces sp. NP160 TaxID=2586637 RepID=UPI0011193378|nr:alpha/beta hydrolase [Streptomyces sp. NP160]TNM68015.1 alpha/beta hydrolase [Streptomyces sp. NP160]